MCEHIEIKLKHTLIINNKTCVLVSVIITYVVFRAILVAGFCIEKTNFINFDTPSKISRNSESEKLFQVQVKKFLLRNKESNEKIKYPFYISAAMSFFEIRNWNELKKLFIR